MRTECAYRRGMTRSWLAVLALALVACKGKPEDSPGKRPGSAVAPEHVPLAVPTTTTMTVKDFLAQASGGGSAWALRHVRVRGVLDAIERDGSGCISVVTLRDGDASVRCALVDPEPAPLHAPVTVDGQVKLEDRPPSLTHCRMMAPPGGPEEHEPACADPTEKPPGSAAGNPLGSAAP